MGQEEFVVLLFAAFLLTVVIVCSYMSVKTWIDARRMERETFYRTEALKKFVELQGYSKRFATQSKKRADLQRGVMTTTVNVKRITAARR